MRKLVLALSCAAAACSAPAAERPAATTVAPQPAASTSDARQLTISVLGINDLHGRISALPAFAGYVRNLRAVREQDGGGVLVVDAGDIFQGTLESNLTEGASAMAAYGALGLHAATIGNHEFDFGPIGEGAAGDPHGAIKARLAEAPFPMLSANLVEVSTRRRPPWPGLVPSALLEVAGARIGLVGALTAQTPRIVMPAFFTGLDVVPLAPAIAAEAGALRQQGATVVVAVVHAGADCQAFDDPRDRSSCKPDAEIFDVAQELPPEAVDAIFAGHTHAGVAHFVGDVPVVEAYSRGKAFSRVDLILDGHTRALLRAVPFAPEPLCPDTSTLECQPGSYEGAPVTADAELAQVIAPALAIAAGKRAQRLGPDVKGVFELAPNVESALGNLLTDATLEAVPGADGALLNGGGFRAALQQGPLTYGALYEAMPFDNRLAKIVISGEALARVLEGHLAHNHHGIVSLAGLTAEARCEAGAVRVRLRRRGGKLVAPGELLTIATSDYLATGGDRLFAPAALSRQQISPDLGIALREAMAERLSKRRTLAPEAVLDRAHPRLKLPSPRPLCR